MEHPIFNYGKNYPEFSIFQNGMPFFRYNHFSCLFSLTKNQYIRHFSHENSGNKSWNILIYIIKVSEYSQLFKELLNSSTHIFKFWIDFKTWIITYSNANELQLLLLMFFFLLGMNILLFGKKLKKYADFTFCVHLNNKGIRGYWVTWGN